MGKRTTMMCLMIHSKRRMLVVVLEMRFRSKWLSASVGLPHDASDFLSI